MDYKKNGVSTTTRFKLRLGYIDNSYWDDGSRWTTETLTFSDKKSMLRIFKEIKAKGSYLIQGQEAKQEFSIHSIDVTEETSITTSYHD